MNIKKQDFLSNNEIKIVFESNYVTVTVLMHVHRHPNKTKKNLQNQNDCISKLKVIYKNCVCKQ
jgi:hypothetical protein